MHTSKLQDDDGRTWYVIHNGDWSGNVQIKRFDKDPDDPSAKLLEHYVFPGTVIRAACAQAVVSDVIRMLEQWDGGARSINAAMTALLGARR